MITNFAFLEEIVKRGFIETLLPTLHKFEIQKTPSPFFCNHRTQVDSSILKLGRNLEGTRYKPKNDTVFLDKCFFN